MLHLPILLTASLHESRLWQFQSPTHVSESSVVSWCCKISCQGSPSNPIAFFGRKDWRREGAKKVSGRLQLLEEINTWQKQRRKERESLPIGLGRGEDAGLAFGVLGGGGGGGGGGQREQKRKDRVRAGRDWETQEVKVREPEIREAE